jgi:surface antigen
MKLFSMVNLLDNVASFVRNLMAVGKSCIILTISIGLLSACSAQNTLLHTSESSYASTQSNYQPVNTSVGGLINYFSWTMNRMEPYDQQQQEQAVFFALNNLQNGETTRWYNGNTGAQGAVRVAMTYPQGSGYCRVIMSQIFYNGKQRDFKETACVNAVDNSWRFIR